MLHVAISREFVTENIYIANLILSMEFQRCIWVKGISKALFALIMIFVYSCNEYTDVYLKARKDLFYEENVVAFRHLQSNTTISLEVNEFGCNYERYHDIQTSTHAYNRYYPQLCGQSVRQSDDHTHPLDHSISTFATSYIYMNTDMGWIYFQHDYFVIDPLPGDEDAEIVPLGMDGVLYEQVYRLSPKELQAGHEIEELYFHKEHGILRVVSVDEQVWDRVF